MVVGIGAGYLDGFLPNMRVGPEFRIPVKFDQFGGPLRIDEAKGVHPKPFHHAQAARYSSVRHHPHDRMDGLGHQRRSEEHTSELQSLMRISYAVFCLKK